MSGMMFDTQLTVKIAAAAGQSAINIASFVKKSKDMRRIVEDIQVISMDIYNTNKKLDALIEMGQDQVLGRLIAANKKLATCIAAKAFTSQDIQTLEELYLPNTGLSKDGQTGAYSNSRIIAHSWWGLILLESQTGADVIKIARYIVEMFDADFLLAKKTFPEICQEFYQPFIDKYDEEERCYITRLSMLDTQSLNEELYKSDSGIRYFLDFYGVKEEFEEAVRKELKTLRGKATYAAVGVAVAAGMIGGMMDSEFGHDVQEAIEVVRAGSVRFCLRNIVSNRMNDSKYQDKRRRIVIDMLTSSYLDALRR